MNASVGERLTAANTLLDEARKLVTVQEQEVARMRAAGLNTTRALSLLEAYRVSLRLAEKEKAEVEEAIAVQR